MTVAPPLPPSSPPEREALIREARERQRRRQRIAAASVAIAATVAMTAYALFGQGAQRTAGAEAGRPACGEGCGLNLPSEMLAVTSLWYQHGDFYGNGLVRVDPKTLRPLQRDSLRLGDAVTSPVVSPDRNQIALGGYNMGEILFADRKARHVSRLTLIPHWRRHDTIQVNVLAWPSRSRLIAVATLDMSPWWALKRSELFVVDPISRRIIRRVPLHGSLEYSTVTTGDGTTVFVVAKAHDSRAVVVTPSGSTWSVSLRGLDLQGGRTVRVDGSTYSPTRSVSLATDGRDHVFVVAADRPIGEIRLREHELRFHRASLPRTYFSYPKPESPGTGGVALKFDATATWLGGGILAIGGSDELPVATPGGAWNRYATRDVQLVDTRRWARTRTIHASNCKRDGTVFLCEERVAGRDGHGPSIVAYDSSWRRLWARGASTELGWVVTAGRLLAWPVAGSAMKELNPATGRALRGIDPVVQSDAGDVPTLIALR